MMALHRLLPVCQVGGYHQPQPKHTHRQCLFNWTIYILSIMLHRSECWVLSKADANKIEALDQWDLSRILNICWYQCMSNHEVRE